MSSRTYWLDLFTGTTWQQFLDAGAEVSGFRENRSKIVQKIKPGDYFLCYLTGISRFIGVLEVTSKPLTDTAPIWGDGAFPCRVRVKPVVVLTPDTAVPIHELRDSLSIFQDLKSPHAWTGHLRGSPARWSAKDGEVVVAALREAAATPIQRPVDPRKLARRPRGLETKIGPVTVPDADEPEQLGSPQLSPTPEPTDHTEIQYLLLNLGTEMGYSVWVAWNDRSRVYSGKRLSELFRFKDNLPLQFDEATTRTVELIDVLWLKGNAIVSAFEVESTTAIYSGLLRMSDLIAMQPNLSIPLYIVAPDERREKVFVEVNRPTFSRLSPPLVDVCRFIGFSALRQRLDEVGKFARYLRPEFIEELSEECTLEQA